MFKALQDLIVAGKPDLIVATSKASLVLPPLIARWHRIPYVLLVEGLGERNVKRMRLFPGIHYLVKRVEWLNARSARDVYAAYEEVKQRYDSLRTSSQRKAQLFHVAVDPDLFQPTAIAAARKRLNLSLSDSDFVVGFVGSFKPYHSLSPCIEAASDLVKEIPELKLLLVGEGPDHKKIEDLVRRKGLEDHALFTGFVPHQQISTFISACDVMYSVISPDHWGNPIKCYESLACERPVIIRETVDLAFVAKKHFGAVVKSTDPEELSGAIKELYNLGIEHRLSIGRAGRHYILKYHTWDRLVKLILNGEHS